MDKFLSDKLKILSFVAIIMVVYLHSYNLIINLPDASLHASGMNINTFVQTFISNGITRIAVPLFFMISGYLFFINFETPTAVTFYLKLKNRFQSLLIPFMFWSILAVSMFFILQIIPITRPFFTDPQNIVANFTPLDFFNRIFIEPMAYQLWFMHDLIIYVCLTPIIYYFIIKLRIFCVMMFLFCWMYNVSFIWASNEGIFFFVLGSYFSLSKININFKLSASKALSVTFLWLIIMLYKTYSQIANEFNNFYLHKILILIGLYAVWNIYDVLIKNEIKNMLLKCSSYTFFIYATHEPALTMLRKISLRILGFSASKALLAYLINPIITIFCALVIGSILKKRLPAIYSIVVGGRDMAKKVNS